MLSTNWVDLLIKIRKSTPESELIRALRDTKLPGEVVPLSALRRPFSELNEETTLGYLDFLCEFPEALGRLSLAVKAAFNLEVPCPLEYTIKESHFDLNILEPDLLQKLVQLGFEPDHFATLNPPEYKWCLTMKMEIPAGVPLHGKRVRRIHDMMYANSLKAKELVEAHKAAYGYLEMETYSSKSRHVLPFRPVNPEALETFPFAKGEFELIQPPSTALEAIKVALPLDVHKMIDIHVKIPTEVRGSSFVGANSPGMLALRQKFIEAGFYEIYSEAGNYIYTVQLIDSKSSKPIFAALTQWADQNGGIVGIKMETCNYFYRTPRQINGSVVLAPIPNLARRREIPA